MPCNYKDYPADWPERRARVLARANNCCEECGVANGLVGWRFPSGRWITPEEFGEVYMSTADENAAERILAKPARPIILTVAHLDRTGPPGPNDGPLDCPDDRLKALCQRCHLHLDAARHQAKAAETRRRKMGALPLFG